MALFVLSFGVASVLGFNVKCFVKGTLILTSIGLVKIEDIKEDDEVWAYDEKTGQKALKKVTNLFKNKTDEWVHLQIKNSVTFDIEEIICTPNHRIFVNGKWCEACNILENDKVLLYNDVVGIVIDKTTKKLDNIESTYNFEVEDYHTYYVGSISILVHNDCVEKPSGSYILFFKSGKMYIGKGNINRMWQSVKEKVEKFKTELIDYIFDEAPNSRQGFINEYKKMQKYGFKPGEPDFNKVKHKYYNQRQSPGKKYCEQI